MIDYIYKKLVAAGFAFTILIVGFWVMSQMNLFELSQTLNELLLWFAFYGYGIICSIIIDSIIKVWPTKIRVYLFYCFFGFIPFILIELHMMFILIAGSVGVLAALLFFVGLKYITEKRLISIVFAIILPLLFLFVSTQDFTKKSDWDESKDESSFEASFTYFDGEHKIPIDLNKGEKIAYIVLFNETNDGGWGYHFENKKGDHVGMQENGDYLEYKVEDDGRYFIVVHGDRVKGTFSVEWEIQ